MFSGGIKRATGFLCVVGAMLILVSIVGQLRRDYREHGETISSYKPMDESSVSENKPFVILIPSYNNEEYCERNLRSVFEQDYDNYRVIYIDDCSTDDTLIRVKECLKKFNKESKVTLVANQENKQVLANAYFAISSCKNEEIIVSLDGDDWFANTSVLSTLNRYYNDPHVWMTYGQLIEYPSYKRGSSKEPLFSHLRRGKIRKGWHYLRKNEWIFSQLRTFYAGLFKRIQVKDLVQDGGFYTSAGDICYMCPLLEMSRDHTVFIPDILYVYNRETPLNDDKLRKKTQVSIAKKIYNQRPYEKLTVHPATPLLDDVDTEVDAMIFSDDSPIRLYAFLESLECSSKSIGHRTVLYQSSNGPFDEGYEIVKQQFPSVNFVRCLNSQDIQKGVSCGLNEGGANFVFLSHDRLVLKNDLEFYKVVEMMERTGGSVFHLQLGLHVSEIPDHLLPIGHGCFLWQPVNAKGIWKDLNTMELSVYRKSDVSDWVRAISASTLDEFEKKWRLGKNDTAHFLCLSESRVVDSQLDIEAPLGGRGQSLYSKVELNERLLEGYKIDVSRKCHMKNRDSTIAFYPNFVKRDVIIFSPGEVQKTNGL